MFLFALFGFAFLALEFSTLSLLKMVIIAALSIIFPWLLYAIMMQQTYQAQTEKQLQKVTKDVEQIFLDLEDVRQKSDQSMLSDEIKAIQLQLQQVLELEGVVSKNSRVLGESDQEAITRQQGHTATVLQMPQSVGERFPNQKSQGQEDEVASILDIPTEKQKLLNVVQRALSADRIEMLMQPIVSLPQRKVRHFECYSRIREEDGTIYTPDSFLALAEERNLIRLVDNAILFRCIQLIRASIKRNFDVKFFVNVSKYTLGDDFFFESLIEFLRRNRELAGHMVFEFHVDVIKYDLDKLAKNFRKLKNFDCYCSVDHVNAPDLSLTKLSELNFKYVKIETSAFLAANRNNVLRFLKLAAHHRIDVIASHVESENQAIELQDFNIDYGQGYLFGAPVLNHSK